MSKNSTNSSTNFSKNSSKNSSTNSSTKSSTPESTSSLIYSGTALYGRIRVIISSIVGGLICIGLIIMGIKVLLTKDIHSKHVAATVSNSTCNSIGNNTYTCVYTLTFNVNEKTYMVNKSETVSTPILNGSTINVSYNPDNPNDIETGISHKTLGLIMIGAGLLIALVLSIILYFTMKYKQFAAVEGVVGAIGDISRF